MLVVEEDFKAKLFFINPSSKELVYLKCQVNETNVSMLVDTKVTNFFMAQICKTYDSMTNHEGVVTIFGRS